MGYASKAGAAAVQAATVTSEDSIRLEQELKYYFYQAMQDFDRQKVDEAMALLLHCEQIAPNDAAVNHYLGIMYSALEDERGFRYHLRAYQLCPKEYWYPYVVQLFNQDKKQEAIHELELLCKRFPDNAKIHETLQQMYLNTGKLKAAIRQQDAIDAISGSSPYGAMQRFQMYMQLGQMKKASKAITDYLKEDPTNYYLQVVVGDVELNNEHPQNAYRIYSEIQKSFPENPYLPISWANYHGRFGTPDSAAYFMRKAIDSELTPLSYKLSLLNDYPWLTLVDTAEEAALKSLVKQYPQDESSIMALAQYYTNHQQDSLAVPLLWTATDINPTLDKVWQTLWAIYQADSLTTDSAYEQLARRAVVARPQQKQWYSMLAMAKLRQQDLDSALYFCREGLRQPEEVDLRNKLMIYFQMAQIYVERNELDSAYHYYDMLLTYDPENAEVLNNYAYTLAVNGGDLRKAEKMSALSLKKAPNSATFLDTYAWILHLQGQDTLARFFMQRAWESTKDKTNPEILEHYQVIIGEKQEKTSEEKSSEDESSENDSSDNTSSENNATKNQQTKQE